MAATTAGISPELNESVATKRVGRPFEAIAASIFGGLILSGVILRVGSLRPSNLFGASAHGHVFSVHAALTLAAIPLFLVYLSPRTKPDAGIRAVLATVFVFGAGLVGLAPEAEKLAGSGVLVKTGMLVTLGGLAVYGWSIVRPQLRSPTGGLLAFAAASVAVGLLGVLVGRPVTMGMALFPVVLAVLVLPVLTLRSRGEPVGGTGMLVAIGIYVVCRTAARFFVEAAPLALPELIAGVVVGVAVFRSGRRERSSWDRWLRRVEALFFMGGLMLTALLHIVGGEVHLNDTLFSVAAAHLEAFVLLFAVLRGLDGAAWSRVGWTGFVLAAFGGHLFGYGCMVLGSRGMPRRYAAYLGEFTSLQTIASVGSFVLLSGLLMVVVAHVLNRHRGEPATISPPAVHRLPR